MKCVEIQCLITSDLSGNNEIIKSPPPKDVEEAMFPPATELISLPSLVSGELIATFGFLNPLVLQRPPNAKTTVGIVCSLLDI